ncbi:hypothetical protein ACJX0J_020962, partial [Zea mays]
CYTKIVWKDTFSRLFIHGYNFATKMLDLLGECFNIFFIIDEFAWRIISQVNNKRSTIPKFKGIKDDLKHYWRWKKSKLDTTTNNRMINVDGDVGDQFVILVTQGVHLANVFGDGDVSFLVIKRAILELMDFLLQPYMFRVRGLMMSVEMGYRFFSKHTENICCAGVLALTGDAGDRRIR